MIDILAASSAAASAPPAWTGWVLPVGMILIIYFIIIRPQMRQQKAHQAKVAGIKKGDQVVTAGGLLGKVVKVDDAYAEVEIAKGVVVKAVKQTIGDVIQPAGAKPAND